MPKTKSGEEIDWKEFFSRWKKGIEGITPLQQINMQLRSTHIILVGIICGIAISIHNLNTLWWLLIILSGAFFNTAVQWIGVKQKQMALKRIEESAVDINELGMDVQEYLKGGEK